MQEELTRRRLLVAAGRAGLAATIAAAVPVARAHAQALPVDLPVADPDATLQAFADTMLPGRPATTTDLGLPIHPRAIAGVDPLPGAVEADALALYHHEKVGFEALAPAFLAELQARSLPRGGDFLALAFGQRLAVCVEGTAFANPTRVLWEAAAAVPFTAFCAAALAPGRDPGRGSGFRVMGHPGAAPAGYADASYGRRLARERTATGNLP